MSEKCYQPLFAQNVVVLVDGDLRSSLQPVSEVQREKPRHRRDQMAFQAVTAEMISRFTGRNGHLSSAAV